MMPHPVSTSSFWIAGALITLFVTQSCSKPSPLPSWDATYNPERIKRGIPALPVDWVQNPDYKARDRQMWIPRTKQTGIPWRMWKIIETHAGVINREDDGYASGETYEYHDADGRTETRVVGLVVSYSYVAEREGKDPWRYIYSQMDGSDKELSRAEANRLLLDWHLPGI